MLSPSEVSCQRSRPHSEAAGWGEYMHNGGEGGVPGETPLTLGGWMAGLKTKRGGKPSPPDACLPQHRGTGTQGHVWLQPEAGLDIWTSVLTYPPEPKMGPDLSPSAGTTPLLNQRGNLQPQSSSMFPKADLIIRCMVTKRVSVERAEIRGSGTSGDSDAAQRSAAPGLIGTSGDSDAA
ncbi:unnamed protein product [Arctogadus glacialis]